MPPSYVKNDHRSIALAATVLGGTILPVHFGSKLAPCLNTIAVVELNAVTCVTITLNEKIVFVTALEFKLVNVIVAPVMPEVNGIIIVVAFTDEKSIDIAIVPVPEILGVYVDSTNVDFQVLSPARYVDDNAVPVPNAAAGTTPAPVSAVGSNPVNAEPSPVAVTEDQEPSPLKKFDDDAVPVPSLSTAIVPDPVIAAGTRLVIEDPSPVNTTVPPPPPVPTGTAQTPSPLKKFELDGVPVPSLVAEIIPSPVMAVGTKSVNNDPLPDKNVHAPSPLKKFKLDGVPVPSLAAAIVPSPVMAVGTKSVNNAPLPDRAPPEPPDTTAQVPSPLKKVDDDGDPVPNAATPIVDAHVPSPLKKLVLVGAPVPKAATPIVPD